MCWCDFKDVMEAWRSCYNARLHPVKHTEVSMQHAAVQTPIHNTASTTHARRDFKLDPFSQNARNKLKWSYSFHVVSVILDGTCGTLECDVERIICVSFRKPMFMVQLKGNRYVQSRSKLIQWNRGLQLGGLLALVRYVMRAFSQDWLNSS